MPEETQFENASQRRSYMGTVFEAGAKLRRREILESLDPRFSKLHDDGKIHIHNLEAYGQTYNCLMLNTVNGFPIGRLKATSEPSRIFGVFDHFKVVISKLANEQSGGIGFANFDEEMETLFYELGLPDSDANLRILRECTESFIDWINGARERGGRTGYYVSLNLGLGTGKVARFVTRSVLAHFKDSSMECIKPNIIFKVKKGVNHSPGDPNFDLFCLSVESTCKKMVPTYLLCDSRPNANVDSHKLAIMGCRTRVVQNLFGEDTCIGRGNIAFTTINLPRIALEIDRTSRGKDTAEKVRMFKEEWDKTADVVRDLLIDRYNRLLGLDPDDFPCNLRFNLWTKPFTSNSLEEIFKNGTLAIGFIGLSEAVRLLTGGEYYASEKNHAIALDIVRHMRRVIDGYRRDCNLNFSLLGTSAEFVSGRFPSIDYKLYGNEVSNNGFYTNSFHVRVDSGLHPIDKLRFEGPFHELCNGGCISYVEFGSALLKNTEAVTEVIEAAERYGVSYLGINFPSDTCLKCNITGTFDDCPNCGSHEIYRVRRVSGFLEDLRFFTAGKKAEVAHRRPNPGLAT
ncbi:MAG: anaerobic ribonucleoside-triphosphate reductase [Nitrososphaerales archaeon]|jgi:ribonucleoside-triphosphate reductase